MWITNAVRRRMRYLVRTEASACVEGGDLVFVLADGRRVFVTMDDRERRDLIVALGGAAQLSLFSG